MISFPNANLKLPKWLWMAGILLLVLLLGVIDLITGDYSLIVYYTIPVGLGSWFIGAGFGISVAIFSCIVRFFADYITYSDFSFVNYLTVTQDIVYLLLTALILANLRARLTGDK